MAAAQGLTSASPHAASKSMLASVQHKITVLTVEEYFGNLDIMLQLVSNKGTFEGTKHQPSNFHI